MELKTLQWGPSSAWSSPLPAWDGPTTLVLAFGASDLIDEPAPLRDLARAYPNAAVVGCSTAGEILGETVSDGTLSVAVARFAHVRPELVAAPVRTADESQRAGFDLGRMLMGHADRDEPGSAGDREGGERDPLRAVFVLSDGLAVNGSALVAGLLQGTERTATITGGLAGDGDRFARTWVLVNGEPVAGHVTAVGLRGSGLRVTHGTRGGWDIFGPERRITRSEGNVLYELDGKPALGLYKTYLGDRAAGLPATALLFPLAVRVPGAGERQLVRTVLAVDEAEQSMTFAGDVPEGSLAQLMRANFDRLVDGAHDAALAACEAPAPDASDADESAGPTLGVAISCVGRRLVLGRRTEDELEATVSGLRPATGLVGFYSYGEISPIAASSCDLHNQTMTVTTFREAA